MFRISSLSLLCALGGLSGCAAVDSVNAYLEEVDKKKEEERIAKARTACEKYGFESSTEAFSQCVQTEVNNVKNRAAIAEAARRAEPIVPTTTTTSCTKTLLGMDCTSR